jgi:hypothetical protein
VAAALVYVASSAWMFWKAFGRQPGTLLWTAGVVLVGLGAWAVSRGRAAVRA